VAGFRSGTPSLALLNRKWNWEKVLAACQSVLPNFIRNKPEIDKAAIILQREELAEVLPLIGVKVKKAEGFFVDANLTQVETREVAK
jgi:phage host-nuclease inhibitor protein Gam